MTIGGAMDPNAITVGVDVSKAELVVAVHPSGERWVSGTSAAAVDALVDRLVRLHPVLVVVEATGGYERALVAACATAQVPIAVINPRQVANHQSDVATRCFRDGFPPLATACVNQDAVPVGSQHPCCRASDAVGRSGDADDRHDRHRAQAGGPARTAVADS